MNEDERPDVIRMLRKAVADAERDGNIAFAWRFVRSGPEGGTPPLAHMLRGGRGGEVRLRIYLTITMMATSPPYDVRRNRRPAGWARLLGLEEPDTLGARRVNAAMEWLRDEDLIRLQPRKGSAPRILLRDPLVRGRRYTRPSTKARYVGIPSGLWSNGWIVDLTATGLALLLVLKERLGGTDGPQYITSERRAQYGLSHGTWTRATKELQTYGLITVERVLQGDPDYDSPRLRNQFELNLERLESESTRDERERAAAVLSRQRSARTPA